MRRLRVLDVAAEARNRVRDHARQHPVLGRTELLLLERDDALLEIADVAPVAFDFLLHLDDGHVGDDGERGVEQRVHLFLAVFFGLGPERRDQELVLAGKLLRFRALLGNIVENAVDGRHELARLLVVGIARARIGRLFGRGPALCARERHGRLLRGADEVGDAVLLCGLSVGRGRGQQDQAGAKRGERSG